MTPNRGLIRFLIGGEHYAYATATTPRGILNSVLKALEHRGITRAQIEKHDIDIEALEKAFDAIDARAFERLLKINAYGKHLQIVPIEHQHNVGDPGTLFGHVH